MPPGDLPPVGTRFEPREVTQVETPKTADQAMRESLKKSVREAQKMPMPSGKKETLKRIEKSLDK